MKDNLIENSFFKLVTPVYNTSKYLDKCIQSVLNQTFKDWVWVLVDDLSTDGSYEKLLEYEKQYPEHIKVLRVKEKSYPGKARNFLKLYALQCQYVFCIDSDDWLADENVLQKIYNEIKQNNYPDLYFNNYMYLANHKVNFRSTNDINDIILKEGAAPWKYVVKTKIYQTATFSESFNSVDICWFLSVMDNINSAVVSKTTNYIYNDNNGLNISVNSHKDNINKKYKNTKIIINDLNSLNLHNKNVIIRKNIYLRDMNLKIVKYNSILGIN